MHGHERKGDAGYSSAIDPAAHSVVREFIASSPPAASSAAAPRRSLGRTSRLLFALKRACSIGRIELISQPQAEDHCPSKSGARPNLERRLYKQTAKTEWAARDHSLGIAVRIAAPAFSRSNRHGARTRPSDRWGKYGRRDLNRCLQPRRDETRHGVLRQDSAPLASTSAT